MIQRLGPGLLFAASAVGVSHLVQSTRAGAQFGLTMAVLIVLACLIKYPAFRFGAEYGASARESLIVGYARQGRWLLVVCFLAIAIEGLAVIPAVSLVAAGMTMNFFGIEANEIVFTMATVIVCSILLLFGRYRVLEGVTKALVAIFAVLSVVAAVAAAASIESGQTVAASFPLTADNVSFAVALAGWMPAGMGGAVFISLWTTAKADAQGRSIALADARFDFNVGYFATIALALCFLVMGAALLFGSPVEMSENSVGFAAQLVGLFTQTVGVWIKPIIELAALAVMFSTVLTVIDGFARVYVDVTQRLAIKTAGLGLGADKLYVFYMCLQAIVAFVLLWYFLQRFGQFIDFVTTVGFIVAPVIAALNHRLMSSQMIASDARPPAWLRAWSLCGVVVLTAVSLSYLIFRFG